MLEVLPRKEQNWLHCALCCSGGQGQVGFWYWFRTCLDREGFKNYASAQALIVGLVVE